MIPPFKMTEKELQTLISMLELDMVEYGYIQSFLETLDSSPEVLLPQSISLVEYAAFCLTKADHYSYGQRALLACLAWCIENGYEDQLGQELIELIYDIFKDTDLKLELQEIRDRAIARDYAQGDIWGFNLLGEPEEQESYAPTINLQQGAWKQPASFLVTDDQDSPTAGDSWEIMASVSSKLPLTKFKGWLKQLESDKLNPSGRALMKEVFSRFNAALSPEQYIEEYERLSKFGVRFPQQFENEMASIRYMLEEGVQVHIKRMRRFAGGDGRLPRGCYSTICSNSQGDDGGTLNRELMAYVHPSIPGTIFVGDSSDQQVNDLLNNQIGVLPGYCASYVFMIKPEKRKDRKIYNKVYSETLELSGGLNDPVHVLVLGTRVKYIEIEGVIDLRLPKTQEWFFTHFKNGDGVHFYKQNIKTNGQPISGFCEMLPTLMDLELGGCPTTEGIGSWMRTNGLVNALIYPSSRSDVMTSIRDGKLDNFRGWNLVDYRKAKPITSREVVTDQNPWYDFNEIGEIYNQPGITLQQAARDSRNTGSWEVQGNQRYYDELHQFIVS